MPVCAGTSVFSNVSASASANTKGSWTQLTASSAIDTAFMAVILRDVDNLAFVNAVDIGVGAAGSEMVVFSNLLQENPSNGTIAAYLIPCSIPIGTRIAARSQADIGSNRVAVTAILFASSFLFPIAAAGIDSIGFSTATSQGTDVDAGGTASTKGSYAQLTASTSRDYCGFFISIDPSGANAASRESISLDIAIGGAGSETIIVPNVSIMRNTSDTSSPAMGPFLIEIPSGTRIAARSSCTSNSSPTRVIAVTLYGLYK